MNQKGRYLDINNKYHREDGPAINEDNYSEWLIHGVTHREDGPAIIYHNNNRRYWVINNKRIL